MITDYVCIAQLVYNYVTTMQRSSILDVNSSAFRYYTMIILRMDL